MMETQVTDLEHQSVEMHDVTFWFNKTQGANYKAVSSIALVAFVSVDYFKLGFPMPSNHYLSCYVAV